jgi:Double-GTPase 1
VTEATPLRLCLVGLPATGKTTYIAALWAYLRSGLDESKWRVLEVPENTTYLNLIAQAWLDRKEMPRSAPGATDTVQFTVQTPDGQPVTIVVPDLPGEMFLNAVRRPAIDTVAAAALTESQLLLIFVNGQKASTYAPLGDQEPPDGAEEEETDGEGGGGDENPADTDAGITPPLPEFVISDLDSDTLNTELLQRVLYLLRDQAPPTLVVVVSAWDVLDGTGKSPEKWLKDEQPMTWQFIDELRIRTTVGVIGVSAQGADYGDHPTIHQTTTKDRPWGRDGDLNKTEITGPLVLFGKTDHSAPL